MEDTEWLFGTTSAKIEYDPDIEPEWGWLYAHQMPADLLRDVGVFGDEYMTQPLRDYVKEGQYVFCNVTEIYVKYVDFDFINDIASWPAYFKRIVAARLAKDAAGAIKPERQDYADNEYADRKMSAMTNDAIQHPPQKIHGGSWVRSRGRYDRWRH